MAFADRKTVKQFRLIGYENRKVADEDFRNDSVDGGEVGPGHTVTALYAVRLREGASGTVASATVRWLDPKTRKAQEETGTVTTGSVGGALWGGENDRLQIAAVAAYFADRLRGGDLPGAIPASANSPPGHRGWRSRRRTARWRSWPRPSARRTA